MSSFEVLILEHDVLAHCLERFEALLDPARPNATEAVSLRDTFRDLLMDHLSREDVEVYPQLMVCDHIATAEVAHRFAADFDQLTSDWHCYLDEWIDPPGIDEWPEFCRESKAMAARIHSRIAEENALLYPTALAASVISLRAR